MARNLDDYNSKRNFDKTKEPEGNNEKSNNPLRFVIQYHQASRTHFDFRLEWKGVLLSWAVPKGPSFDTLDKRLAVEVEEHPIEYSNFEGNIPKDEYGGGVVMLWDEGYWEPQVDVDSGLKEGSLKFILNGKRLKGKWALVRMNAKAEKPEKNWLLIKEKDQYTQKQNGISEFITSIRTGRAMDEIKEGKFVDTVGSKNPFDKVDVQLAKLVNKVPEENNWLYELKYDGYRIVAYLEGGNVRLMTRNGHDFTMQFKTVADSLIGWVDRKTMILDGEIAILDTNGKTDFQALQKYIKNPTGDVLVYTIFDLLALSGSDLRNNPLIERKILLEILLRDAPGNLHFSSHTSGKGKEIFLAACQANMEGIICKKADSIYSGTRNGDWLKIKCENRQEFVIGGFALTNNKKSGVSAILLGVYDGAKLICVGRAGTGFADKNIKELSEKFKDITSNKPHFFNVPEQRNDETITWLEPSLVAEIKFAEWTDQNLLRQASYKGLRTDKDPRDVKREWAEDESMLDEKPENEEKNNEPNHRSIIINKVRLTSPDKLIFEDDGITKQDVAQYYVKMADRLMPYMENRILSILRCPEGQGRECFYQKHLDQPSAGIGKISVIEKSGETGDYFYIKDVHGLLTAVQMGTVEFHTWGSQVDHLEMPDMITFDLDPDDGLGLERVREGVRDMKIILDELSLVSYLKTSGGKGYHVVIPVEPFANWDIVRNFAKLTATAMEQRWPDRYTSNPRKEQRKGKIFIDWIRNGRGATSVAPYSLRARKGAPVSMPIRWDELDLLTPNGINMMDALKRITEKDPWKDFFQTKQRLKGDVM